MSGSEDSTSEWQFVKQITDNDQSSVDDSQSDGSVEVVSIETDNLDIEESVLEPTTIATLPSPYFILRVPSSEQDFTTESESSDDSDNASNKSGSEFRLISPRKSALAKTASVDDSEVSCLNSASFISRLSAESSRETSPDSVSQLLEIFEKNSDEDIQIAREMKNSDINSVHDFEIIPHVEGQPLEFIEHEEEEHVEAGIPNVLVVEENGNMEEGNQEQHEPANVLLINDVNLEENEEEENEDENFIIVDDTESSVEMEDEDDRIESDQSTVQHSDDHSNISNLDIGDLMADPNLIRQYVHRPNSHLNVTLNTVVILVIAVAVGLGIGHAIGSKRERFMQRRMWQDNFKSFIPSALTDQLHDRIEVLSRKEKILMKDVMSLQSELKKVEGVKQENSRLHVQVLDLQEKYSAAITQDLAHNVETEQHLQEKHKLQKELMKYKNEVLAIKSELFQADERQQNAIQEIENLKSARSESEKANHMQAVKVKEMENTIIDLKTGHERTLKEREKNLKNIINTLEMEKQDLTHEIGNLRYTLHPGNDADMDQVSYKTKLNLLEIEKSDLIHQVGSMRYSSYPSNKVTTTSAWGHEQMDSRKEDSSILNQMNNTVKELKERLVMEERRSEMWQKLYLASQRENKRTRTDNSSSDFFGCVAHLLKNVTVPQNFSKMLKEKVDLSLDALKYIYKVLKGESFDGDNADGSEQKNKSKDQHSKDKHKTYKNFSKRGRGKDRRKHMSWKETVEEVLNNTRSSMSDVTKQIHDTWQQVKNLSKDLWEKHQPTLENLQKGVSKKIDIMTAHIQEQLKRTSSCVLSKNCWKIWKSRSEKHWDDMDNKKAYSKREMKYRAKTFRRKDFGNNDENEKSHYDPKFNAKNNVKTGKNKIHKKKLKSLKKLVGKLKNKAFCEMYLQDKESVYDSFEDADTHIKLMTLSETDNLWLSCQLHWWRNAVNVNHLYHTDFVSPHCKQTLKKWQWDIVYQNDWMCHEYRVYHNNKRENWRKHLPKQHIKKNKHYKHKHHKGQTRNSKLKQQHHTEKVTHDLPKKSNGFKGYTTPQNIPDVPKSNLTSFHDCDPFDEKCNSDSWYIQKMHHRDIQRKAEERAMWLLSRGKAREEYRQTEDKEEERASWQFKYAKGRKAFRDAKPRKNEKESQDFSYDTMYDEEVSETIFSCVDI